MSNVLLTPSLITKEALMVLENNLSFTKGVDKQYSEKFGTEAAAGQKIGSSIQVRKPVRYVGRTGAAISVEDSQEEFTTVSLTNQEGVDIQFSSQELTLSIDEFSDRFIKPAMAAIANKIDFNGLALYKSIYNRVGTPGTSLAGTGTAQDVLDPYLNAGVALDDCAVARDGNRNAIVTPLSQAVLVKGLAGLFQDSSDVARQYREGTMGRTVGLKFSMDQNVNTHTVGPLGGTPLVNGATQTGATLVTDGWTASAASRLKQGDSFTIAGVNAVNPQNRQSTGNLQNFVVTADVSSDGSGNVTIAISPSIITSGAKQTVSGSPADNAALTINGAAGASAKEQLVYHRDAFTLASADLEMPKGVDFSARKADKRTGLSVRMVRAYNISTDQFPCRLDVLYGWATLRPELAVRVRY